MRLLSLPTVLRRAAMLALTFECVSAWKLRQEMSLKQTHICHFNGFSRLESTNKSNIQFLIILKELLVCNTLKDAALKSS